MGAEFPVLCRVLETLFEPLLLLVLVDVKIELDNRGGIRRQYLLELVDIAIPTLPDFIWNNLVNALDQYALIVAAVEDSDLALARYLVMVPPEEIVIKLLRGGYAKVSNPDALRVDALEDATNRAVLAASVHRLQHNQELVLVLGPEKLLKFL
jgi:hypothetical protein